METLIFVLILNTLLIMAITALADLTLKEKLLVGGGIEAFMLITYLTLYFVVGE